MFRKSRIFPMAIQPTKRTDGYKIDWAQSFREDMEVIKKKLKPMRFGWIPSALIKTQLPGRVTLIDGR